VPDLLRGMLIALGAFVAWYVVWTVYLAVVLRWEDDASVGLGYYGRTPEGRERYKRSLRRHARLLAPLLWLNSRTAKVDFRRVRIQHAGTSFPAGSCDAASVARAVAYAPRADDVVVVTQMKCGTTWMQHVVYEVLRRGGGDLVASGTALYAVSPWLEGRRSVSLDAAPLVGAERPSRIIKTHLPAHLCPTGEGGGGDARFIYVARHPVSCFASCVDFVRTNVGAMAPDLAAFEAWFCSPDLMWWGTWTDHVAGWWERSRRDGEGRGGVLFLTFEDMTRDLPAVIRRVAAFLGVAPLTDDELARVALKCGFAYMREHQAAFEMHPPHLLQTSAELFVRGSADRHRDVPPEARARVLAWARAGTAASAFPHYRD
jgi:hypothetical protein